MAIRPSIGFKPTWPPSWGDISHPIVVRFDGTNAEEGRAILAEAAPPNLHTEATMLDAARRAVELAA